MLFETPEDTYRAYQRFLKKEEYKKAYRCLEKMLYEFPDDIKLLQDIVDLCVFMWGRPDMGKKWVLDLVNLRSLWLDYIMLSRVEAELGNIGLSKGYLDMARRLQKTQKRVKSNPEPKKIFSDLEGFIKYKEWDKSGFNTSRQKYNWGKQSNTRDQKPDIKNQKFEIKSQKPGLKSGVPAFFASPSLPASPSARSFGSGLRLTASLALVSRSPERSEGEAKNELTDKASPPAGQVATAIQVPSYSIPVKIPPFNKDAFLPFLNSGVSTLKESQLFIDYMYLTIQSGFDDLLCLNAITDVEKYWYQIETVKKVLRHFHGRVLLCDEVGLGKTIEAGMLIKEYLLRGMIKNVLILTPPPLVSQWREEMEAKFGIEFLTTEDIEFARDPAGFWRQRFIIASLNTAKSNKNMSSVIEQLYDLVVVDEAHHLRNRTTLAWKLVNQIKKRFILLLTATPVQNNLIELFNLITLLEPGQFKTERQFRKEYLQKGNLKATADKERLRELLRDVMIRNTRSVIDLKLPRRYATTMRLEPTDLERDIYIGVNEYLRGQNLKKPISNLLLREAGSTPFALKHSLLNMDSKEDAKGIIDVIDNLKEFSKGKALIEILMKNPDEKKIIFTQFIKSMDYITELLWREGIPYVTFRGDMPGREKNVAIARFKNEIPVLVSTESGGEGRNLQFCNTIINFDLPWNPMRIEQRIGRLHRIGQTRDVFIFNLSIKETIEDYILEILDNKINMFEMVIGEIEPILGHLGEDRDFEDIIMEIWLKSGDKESLRDGFEHLGIELVNAKNEYLKTKAMDNEIFGEDYEI